MKRFLSIFLITILSLSSIYVYASETSTDLSNNEELVSSSSSSESSEPSEPNEPSEPSEPSEPAESQVPSEDKPTGNPDSIAPVSEPSLDINPSLTTNNNVIQNETVADDSNIDNSNTLAPTASSDNTTADSTSDITSEETDIVSDDDTSPDTKDENDDTSTEPEHEHNFSYISNGDGTHTIICTNKIHIKNADGETEEIDCDYEKIEACEFDDDNVCIYCKYKKPEEEPIEEITFAPSIDISIINQSCIIGKNNPLICLNAYQDDYDITHAQVCFANYSTNNYINVCLAHGKYYDFYENTFVYKSDNSWYANPDITNSYSPGTYHLRSIYIRSSNNEYIHYSLESNNLPESLKNTSITLEKSSLFNSIQNSLIEDSFTTLRTETPINKDLLIASGEDSNIEEYTAPDTLITSEPSISSIKKQQNPAPTIVDKSEIYDKPAINTQTNSAFITEQPDSSNTTDNSVANTKNETISEPPEIVDPQLQNDTIKTANTEDSVTTENIADTTADNETLKHNGSNNDPAQKNDIQDKTKTSLNKIDEQDSKDISKNLTTNTPRKLSIWDRIIDFFKQLFRINIKN